MNYTTLIYEAKNGIAVITLNRPDRLNAWTPTMGSELADATAKAASDSEVRVIVLTGAGRGFCAGMDHENLLKTEENTARHRRTELATTVPRAARRPDFEGLFNYFPSIGKPVIAAINGPAAGSGLILALACDIRFAAEDAVLTSAFARRALVAEHGIAWLLTQLVGSAVTLDLLLSGRRVLATEAKEMGLVNFVCAPGDALSSALVYAAEMVRECAPRSMQIIKRQVWNAMFESLHDATETANREMLKSFDSVDFKEGMLARAEHRQPQFSSVYINEINKGQE